MTEILNEFVEFLKVSLGQNLKSIILYGSRADDQESDKKSDYNLLVIVEKIDFSDLEGLNKKQMNKWIKNGNIPPLIFTKERFLKSTDVFPIEFLDMKEHHKVLFGENPLQKLKINESHLRHECEFELKGKLLKLRQGFLFNSGQNRMIKEILIKSISEFLVIFRHVVKLLGGKSPKKKLDALNMLADKNGFKPDIFLSILKMKHGDKQALKLNPKSCMEEYLKQIEIIVDLVDNL